MENEDKLREQEINEEQHYSNLAEKEKDLGTEKNPAHYCLNNCGKYLGFRGFCSKKCHNEYYDKTHLAFNHLSDKEQANQLIDKKEKESLIIYFRDILQDKTKSNIERVNARNKLFKLLEEKENEK